MISKRKTFLAERSERTVRVGSRSTEWGGARTGKDERGTLPEWRAERTGKDDSKGERRASGESDNHVLKVLKVMYCWKAEILNLQLRNCWP